MFQKNYQYNNTTYNIVISFFGATILQILPCPLQLLNLPKPSWMNLLLIVWITKLPYKINIGVGFAVGLIQDIMLGPILGVRAITISIITYLLIIKFPFFNNSPIWKKIIIITFFSFNTHVITHTLNILLINKSRLYQEIFISHILTNSILDGIIWFGIFLFVRKIYT